MPNLNFAEHINSNTLARYFQIHFSKQHPEQTQIAMTSQKAALRTCK